MMFLAQGIDLSNIIKNLALVDKYEPILTCLERLTFAAKDKSYELVPKTLQELQIELDKDIGHKVFAGKHKCYNILIDLLKNCERNHTIVKSVLKTITLLMTGNPDLLDDDGIAQQIE